FYLYCKGHMLTVTGSNPFVCGNTVYTFPRTQSFAIDGHRWTVANHVYNSKLEVPAELSRLINSRTFYPQFDYRDKIEDLGRLLQEEEKNNQLVVWENVIKEPSTYYTITGVVVALIVLYIVYYFVRRHRFDRRV